KTHGERGNHLVGVAAHDGIAGTHAQVVEGGLVTVRTGPQQRGAITKKTRPAGDHPDQNGKGAGAGAQRDPKTAVGDQLFGLGGVGDFESVTGQQFNKRIAVCNDAVPLSEGDEALLELREGGFGGSDRPAAGQAAQGQRQSGGSGDRQNQDQSEAGRGYASMRKGQ